MPGRASVSDGVDGETPNGAAMIARMHGRLNSFQRTMLQWNDMHPYNAVHVARIPEALDPERLRNVLIGTLETQGLARLTLNRDKVTYQYLGGSASGEVKMVATEGGADLALSAETERQLNAGFFPDGEFNPFRFWVAPEREAFFLGLAYFHAIADAESVVLLIKDVVNAYLGRSGRGLSSPVDRHPPCLDNLLPSHPGTLARKLLALPSLIRDLRSSCRVRCREPQNFHNGCVFFSLKPEPMRALVEAGKAWEVTLNDLFLALVMKSLFPLASGRMRGKRRRRMSVGCIVNLRRDLGVDSQRTFGLFLGSFIVTHEAPEEISLMNLARDLHRQTLRIKRNRLYLGTPLELGFARFMFSLFSTERRWKFYQKHYPLWGGITNMNLNSLWDQQAGERPVDYFRAVSTGPAIPLVLSVTTVRDHLNVGLTYRSAVFSAPEIEQVKHSFLESLNHLKGQR